MQACVEVWESDPAAYAYNAVGYIALGAPVQESDLTATYERQQRIGYDSELIVGEAEVDAHMKALFPDWRAQGVTVCLHEHQGGFAFNLDSVQGLHEKCRSAGRRRPRGRRGDGLRRRRRRLDHRRRDERGRDRGRRAGRRRARPVGGALLGAARPPGHDRRRTPSGDVVRDRPMWTYWNLQEGEITIDPLDVREGRRRRAAGDPPRHRRAAVHGRRQARDRRAVGHLLQARPARRPGRRVAARRRRRRRARPVPVTTDVDPSFPDMWCAALSHSMSGSRGAGALYKDARSGGVGAFTADNFPVFDYFRPNLYGIFDSNHGYKMIGVGGRSPRVLLGDHSRLLYPVPLRALRDRRPASGLELAVSLVLAVWRREVCGVPRACRPSSSPSRRPSHAFVVVCTVSVTTIASATVVTISSASSHPEADHHPRQRAATTLVSRVQAMKTISSRVQRPRRSAAGRKSTARGAPPSRKPADDEERRPELLQSRSTAGSRRR